MLDRWKNKKVKAKVLCGEIGTFSKVLENSGACYLGSESDMVDMVHVAHGRI